MMEKLDTSKIKKPELDIDAMLGKLKDPNTMKNPSDM